MWRGKPNDSRNLFKLEQPITRRFLNYFSRSRRQSIKNQTNHLSGKIFRPFLKFDAVPSILFLTGGKTCLRLDNELDRSIQFFRSHASSGGVNAKGRDNIARSQAREKIF